MNENSKVDIYEAMIKADKALLISTVQTETLTQILINKGVISPEEYYDTQHVVNKHISRIRSILEDVLTLDYANAVAHNNIDQSKGCLALLSSLSENPLSLNSDLLAYLDTILEGNDPWEGTSANCKSSSDAV